MSRSRSITIAAAGSIVAVGLAGGLTWAFAGGSSKKSTANANSAPALRRSLPVAGAIATSVRSALSVPASGVQIVGAVTDRGTSGAIDTFSAARAPVANTGLPLGVPRTAPADVTGLAIGTFSAPVPRTAVPAIAGTVAPTLVARTAPAPSSGEVGVLAPNRTATPAASAGGFSSALVPFAGPPVMPGPVGAVHAP